jgi:hypothetical protein
MKPLAIVIPVRAKRTSVVETISEISDILQRRPWSVLLVGETPPETGSQRTNVRFIPCVGGAAPLARVLAGVEATPERIVAVMEPGQDPRFLLQLDHSVRSGRADIAIGAQSEHGAFGDAAARLASRALGRDLADPLSRFYVARRGAFEAAKAADPASPNALLALLKANPAANVLELPIPAAPQRSGLRETWDTLRAIARFQTRRAPPANQVAQ